MNEQSYLDNPRFDNTPQAHPAFHRGKRAGIEDVVSIVNNVIKGADTGDGVVNSPVVENVRRNVLTLRRQAQDAVQPPKSSDAIAEFVVDLLYNREQTKQYKLPNKEIAEALQAILKWKNQLLDMTTKTGYLAKKATECLTDTLKVPLPEKTQEKEVESE